MGRPQCPVNAHLIWAEPFLIRMSMCSDPLDCSLERTAVLITGIHFHTVLNVKITSDTNGVNTISHTNVSHMLTLLILKPIS